MCTFGLSGCRVKPRRPNQTGPPGLAHDSPRTPNVHISGHLALQNTTKIPREDPQRDTKRAKRWREREEKARNFGPSHPSGPHQFGAHPSGPTHRGPTWFGPIGVPPFGAPFWVEPRWAKNTKTPKLAKVGEAQLGHSETLNCPKSVKKLAKVGQKVGQSRFGQSRSIKVGQGRSNFSGQSFGQSRIWPKSGVWGSGFRVQGSGFRVQVRCLGVQVFRVG